MEAERIRYPSNDIIRHLAGKKKWSNCRNDNAVHKTYEELLELWYDNPPPSLSSHMDVVHRKETSANYDVQENQP